ncbi:MAG: hypothetical protein CVT90_01260 [Candidatus Altiarchaeales archaeon HGW-Altiarchaeales-3]|nr:MAG: hypothetical protein CVT90_01260 [Candidatus Altiarchaeales archaeon HGW-Altiarchaeales-3]
MGAVQATIHLPKSILFDMRVKDQNIEEFVKKNLAVELYRDGILSLGKATEFAGVKTRWEMMTILNSKGVPINYEINEVKKDIKILDSILGKKVK